VTVVIGTAGHIDHGKTTLLRALTGIDADRLPEERARGMTIDVGYAHLALDDGTELDFVDVPGHDRLVGNMLVGAGEIDAALLVVAADDGPRAQTLEHLELLDALGIRDGIAVVTKADAVAEGRAGAVAQEVRALLEATTLRGSPILTVSAVAGSGLDELRTALVALRDRPSPFSATASRLAVDRVFTIRGRGTVVTGTLRGASIARGALLRAVPGPIGATVRVREVQVHGRAVDEAGPGRVALNVVAGEHVDLERGAVLTTDPEVVATDRILVALRPVTSSGRSVAGSATLPADRSRVVVHAGTAHVTAAVGRSGRDGQDLGHGEGSAILRLDRPIALAAGDRFALRRPSPAGTLGGGRVLDPEPPRGVARRRQTADRLRALATADLGTPAWSAARLDLHGASASAGSAPEVAPDVAAAIDAILLAAIDDAGELRSAELRRVGRAELRRHVGPGLGAEAGRTAADAVAARVVDDRVDALVAAGHLVRDADRVRRAGHAVAEPSAELLSAMDRLVASLTSVAPPSLAAAARDASCPPEGIRLLERSNRIVRLDDDLAWAFPTYRDLAGRAVSMAATAPLTPAAYRDATGTSRKYVMAILEDLDRRAILRRTPAGHVPGPRAPTLARPAPAP
jgi:selenocysteine-specific elongation factor